MSAETKKGYKKQLDDEDEPKSDDDDEDDYESSGPEYSFNKVDDDGCVLSNEDSHISEAQLRRVQKEIDFHLKRHYKPKSHSDAVSHWSIENSCNKQEANKDARLQALLESDRNVMKCSWQNKDNRKHELLMAQLLLHTVILQISKTVQHFKIFMQKTMTTNTFDAVNWLRGLTLKKEILLHHIYVYILLICLTFEVY